MMKRKAIMEEIVRGDFLERVHIALDFSMLVLTGLQLGLLELAMRKKPYLKALLEPTEQLKTMELEKDYTSRLAILEELKTYPWGCSVGLFLLTTRSASKKKDG